MRRLWSDIAAHRETQVFAQRLELTLHAISMVVAAIVLAMRLVAGTQDLSSEVPNSEEGSVDLAATETVGYLL